MDGSGAAGLEADQVIICCTSEQRLFNRIEVIMSLAEAASSCCHWTFAPRWQSSTLLHHESDIVVTVTDDEEMKPDVKMKLDDLPPSDQGLQQLLYACGAPW